VDESRVDEADEAEEAEPISMIHHHLLLQLQLTTTTKTTVIPVAGQGIMAQEVAVEEEDVRMEEEVEEDVRILPMLLDRIS
jgi:hypothetical protein